MTTVHPGRYRHYKGKEYTIIGVARHSETEEDLVVYGQKYGDLCLWVWSKATYGAGTLKGRSGRTLAGGG